MSMSSVQGISPERQDAYAKRLELQAQCSRAFRALWVLEKRKHNFGPPLMQLNGDVKAIMRLIEELEEGADRARITALELDVKSFRCQLAMLVKRKEAVEDRLEEAGWLGLWGGPPHGFGFGYYGPNGEDFDSGMDSN